jgi:hypothetical protein
MNSSELIAAAIDDALNPSINLQDVLFKVKALAYLIKEDHLKQWTNLEINGYAGSGTKVPKYRKVGVIPRVHLVHAGFTFNQAQQPNQPMVLEYLDQDTQKALTSKYINNGIAEVEDMALSEGDGTVDIPHPIYASVSEKIYEPNGWHIHRAWQILPRNQVKGVLSSIRSKVLELLLELKDLDDNITLQSLQQKKAVSDTVNKVLPNITAGANSVFHITQGDNSFQTSNTGAGAQQSIINGNGNTQAITVEQLASIHDLVTQIKQVIDNDPLFDENREEINHDIKGIEVQLQKSEPKPGVLKRAFESLKELASDSAGTAAGHAVFELLKQAPDLLVAAGLG